MNFVNLTPHTINIFNCDVEIMTLSTSGIVARCTQKEEIVGVIDGVVITRQVFSEVYDLPEKIDGVYYVVSRMVAEASGRDDLLVPGPLVRGDNGQPIGCNGLSVI